MNAGTRWSSRSVGSRLQHGIFYLLIRLAGRAPAYGLLFFVVLWYTIRPMTRRRAAAYIAHRFPGAGGLQRLRHCFLMYWTFGRVLVDRAAAGILREFGISASPEDEAALRALHAEGRGLILLTGHVGCWQTSMAGLEILDTQVHVVMHRAAHDVDRHYFEHAGGKAPFSVIDPAGHLGGSLEMMDALKKGHVLCSMGDRVMSSDRNTVPVRFLGGDIRVPFGAYRLASLTGAPVVVFFALRTGPGRATHEIRRVIRVPEGLGRNGDAYRPYAQEFANALEELVHVAPYQFFDFYDLWEHEDPEDGRTTAT